MRVVYPFVFALSLIAVAMGGCATPSGSGNNPTSSTMTSAGASESCDSLGSAVVASADGIEITGTEVENSTSGQIFQFRQQIFETRKGWAQNEIAKRLIEREAKKKNMTIDEFLDKEVAAKAGKPITDSDVKMFYQSNLQMMKKPDGSTAPFDEVKDRIKQHLTEQTTNNARGAYVQGLMAANNVKVNMENPEPPVIAGVSADDDPSKGPKDATVTIIEFSDFQCPACRQADFRLPELLAKFEGKVKFVYRDFPLTKHVDALPASVAGNCANVQGKYWEFHELLFQNQAQLKEEDFKRYAGQVKLDMDKFGKCLKDPKWVAEVQKDMADAEKAGVNSTPTFFINGRIVPGANIPEITRLVEKELAKAGT